MLQYKLFFGSYMTVIFHTFFKYLIIHWENSFSLQISSLYCWINETNIYFFDNGNLYIYYWFFVFNWFLYFLCNRFFSSTISNIKLEKFFTLQWLQTFALQWFQTFECCLCYIVREFYQKTLYGRKLTTTCRFNRIYLLPLHLKMFGQS